jgi:hypothetical protein
MPVDLPPPTEYYQYIDAQSLSPIDAGQVIIEALTIVNHKLTDYQVVFIGQPIGELEQNGHQLMIAPNEPLDLALEYPDHTRKCFDFINVVAWVGYDPNVGRLTNGLKTPEALAKEILAKLNQHLDAKQNPKILISSAGSKYSVENLAQNTLSIDSEGYLRVNDFRLWAQKGGPLKASSFRSDAIIGMEELEGRINFTDKNDPAPMFYIDLNQFFEPSLNEISKEKREDAKGYHGKYLLFLREPGKI